MVNAMIYSDNSRMDENVDINTFYVDNWFIKCIYLNLESLIGLIITVFMIALLFLIQLNQSFFGWIVNDGQYNYYPSYYKVFCCSLFIFIALTIIILWIKLISLFESISFAEEYLSNINDTNKLDKDVDETDLTIDKKMDLCDDCTLVNGNLTHCIGCIYSIYIIYDLIYCSYISNILIIFQFFIIIIVLMAYVLILTYIYTQTMQYQSYTVDFTVLIIISIVWFLIGIIKLKLVLWMTIVCTISIYHSICINYNDYHYIHD